MRPAGYWWTCYESSFNYFPDPAFYLSRGTTGDKANFWILLEGFS